MEELLLHIRAENTVLEQFLQHRVCVYEQLCTTLQVLETCLTNLSCRQQTWDTMQLTVNDYCQRAQQHRRIILDVGGQEFYTTEAQLIAFQAGPNFFSNMLHFTPGQKTYFIDRSPQPFQWVWQFLVQPAFVLQLSWENRWVLRKELDYYGLDISLNASSAFFQGVLQQEFIIPEAVTTLFLTNFTVTETEMFCIDDSLNVVCVYSLLTGALVRQWTIAVKHLCCWDNKLYGQKDECLVECSVDGIILNQSLPVETLTAPVKVFLDVSLNWMAYLSCTHMYIYNRSTFALQYQLPCTVRPVDWKLWENTVIMILSTKICICDVKQGTVLHTHLHTLQLLDMCLYISSFGEFYLYARGRRQLTRYNINSRMFQTINLKETTLLDSLICFTPTGKLVMVADNKISIYN